MKLCCASWSFPHLSLKEIVGLANSISVPAVDLGLFYRGALDKRRLLEEPRALASDVRALGVETPCYYHLFGDDLFSRNCALPGERARNVEDFRAVAQFCKAAGIKTVFILPGVVNPGQTHAEAIEESAETINRLLPIAEDADVTLTIEPHVHSHVESPALVRQLLKLAPGLKLTLDHSHLVCLGYTQAEIDVLIPWAAHVHLRQARPGRIQEKLDYGTINFPAMIGALRAEGYDGWLTLEYVHQDYMNMWNVDVLTETVRMRDLVTPYL